MKIKHIIFFYNMLLSIFVTLIAAFERFDIVLLKKTTYKEEGGHYPKPI